MSCKEFILDSFYIYLYEPTFNILTFYYIETVRNIWFLNCFNDVLMLKMLQFFSIEIKSKSFQTKKMAF